VKKKKGRVGPAVVVGDLEPGEYARIKLEGWPQSKMCRCSWQAKNSTAVRIDDAMMIFISKSTRIEEESYE